MSSHYTDDLAGIPPGSFLIRRISAQQADWSVLDDRGRPRVTKEAVQFYDQIRAERAGCPGPALSMIAEHLVGDLAALEARSAKYGLARISANSIRQDKVCGIQLWTTEEEPAHVVVFRLDGGNKPSDRTRKTWAAELTLGWIVPPPNPSV